MTKNVQEAQKLTPLQIKMNRIVQFGQNASDEELLSTTDFVVNEATKITSSTEALSYENALELLGGLALYRGRDAKSSMILKMSDLESKALNQALSEEAKKIKTALTLA